MVRVTLPDGEEKMYTGNQVPVSEVVASLGPRWEREAVAAVYSGHTVDVHQSITGAGSIRLLRDSDEEAIDVLRHTAAHVLAHAVQELFPSARFAIGPPIENGFYYDFEVERPFTPEDLARIEKRMGELLADGLEVEREEWSKKKAREHFGKLDQVFKLELIDEIPGDTVSIYRVGSFVDLCAGPHLDRAARIKAFKVLHAAGAYWRGDAGRPMLQRIYATAFFKKKDLDGYLTQLAEAEKRDHRKLGRALDLFEVKEEAGGGLVFWNLFDGRSYVRCVRSR